MPRKQHNIHYLYKTTCLTTSRYYFGIHSTSNLEDGYMGSGKRLRYSIRKYGKKNHKKEIIEFFNTRVELEEKENLIIKEYIDDINCINLTNGGTGFKMNHSEETKLKISNNLLGKTYNELHGNNATIEKEKRRDSVKKYWDSLTEEERKIRSDVHKGPKGKHKNPEKLIKCPHCDIIGRASNLKRWHFKNCKKHNK
jgi:hypothetical protein